MEKSQYERLVEAETLLAGIWKEIQEGKIEEGLLQESTYVQMFANRINWMLNERNNESVR